MLESDDSSVRGPRIVAFCTQTWLLTLPAITEQGQKHMHAVPIQVSASVSYSRYLQPAGKVVGDVMLDSPRCLQAMLVTPSNTTNATAAANCF